MTRHVAFLRAVNVGGRTVRKEQLIKAFSSIGLNDISTLKQSGNVIFDSERGEKELVPRIMAELQEQLGFEVHTFVRSAIELEGVVSNDPFKDHGEGTDHLVTFFSDPPEPFGLALPFIIPGSTAKIVAIRGREAYSETHGGGEGGLPNSFLEKTFGRKATTRNINIVREALERCRSK